MPRKVYYRYNPATETYERVYPTRRQRIFGFVRQLAEGIAVGAAILVAVYICIDLPKEKRLTEQNRRLHEQLDELSERYDVAIAVMDRLAERDNNFYRVIMQLDPLTAAQRYAGLTAIPAGDDPSTLADDRLVNSITDKLRLFERQVAVQSQSFDELARAIEGNADRLAHIPSIQPVNQRDMTQMASGYGYRVDPVYGTTKHHDGMDFAAPVGTAVYATADGVVSFAGRNSGYGNVIDIDHGYNYTTRFAHLSQILVHQGQRVSRGDLIGRVGNTGKSTGSHLHYEVRLRDVPQNPVNYYFADLTPEEYARMVADSENAGHVMD